MVNKNAPKSSLSQNDVIHLCQDIINILNLDPSKNITQDKRNTFIDFNVKLKLIFEPSALGLGNTSTS